MQAAVVKFNGIVQGVGFRPFVYRLAQDMGIKGWVNNTTAGVTIHAEGDNVNLFYNRLLAELPPLAKITRHSLTEAATQGFTDFVIVESSKELGREVLISPDVATCKDCIEEIRGPGNRRYQYPFTNCTNCGPRFTIIYDIPYDRPFTTMNTFNMCHDCKREYENPRDRRFHAQPIACPKCGPQTKLVDEKGNVLPGFGLKELGEGAILAIKGLGGFHLACNAKNARAVERLRHRKRREAKPFAVMARDMAVIRKYCEVSQFEERLLCSSAAPIVVLELKGSLQDLQLPESLAPGLNTLGVMLPYTPLHHLLLEEQELLVMTSANLSGDPLIYTNTEAMAKLKTIADYWLYHNRDIYQPCDDSVLRVIDNQGVFFRRARGYVPMPLELDDEFVPVIGVGGDIKNTFCILKRNQAFVSQHGGDLSNYDNYRQFTEGIKSFSKVVNAPSPVGIAYDLHPGYQSTAYAKNRVGIEKIGVQHHHAHLASCLAENGVKEKVIGVILDGTGYGLDGKIWGFEFLWGDRREFQRVGQLEYLPLPGGDRASKFPARIAAGYILQLFGAEFADYRQFLPTLTDEEIQIIEQQVRNKINTFDTSSCGRLFDAVAALAGVCTFVDYEGQAAIELEAAIDLPENRWYPFTLDKDKTLRVRVKPLFKALLEDLRIGLQVGIVAAKFHNTIGEIIIEVVKELSLRFSSKKVALSGGVLQNRYLLEYLMPRLKGQGFNVYRHRELSPGDGGLCVGQAVIASEVIKNVSGHSW